MNKFIVKSIVAVAAFTTNILAKIIELRDDNIP